MGESAEALTLLEVNAKSGAIVDRVAVMETRGVFLSYGHCALIDSLRMTARLLSRQGPGAEAEQAWRTLIHCNPDNSSYYYGFFNSKNIDLGNISLSFWRFHSSSDDFYCLQELLQTLTALIRYTYCKTFQSKILVPLPPNGWN
jgi:hypothetical protein